MKTVLVAVAAGVSLLVVVVGLVFAATFAGLKPLPESAELPGGARLVKDGYVAAFVLPAGDGVALIDCGNDPNGVALLAELSRQGRKPEDVRAIFLTHGHPDHVAACHLFPKAEVHAYAEDAALAGGKARSKGPLPRMFDTPADKQIAVTQVLQDGQKIQVGTLTLIAYRLPGHTAGSAAFLAGNTLYLGDSATAEADGKLRPAPYLFTDDTEQNRLALRALAKRLQSEQARVDGVAYSHSGPSEGPGALYGFQ